jgi:hypothetical protein
MSATIIPFPGPRPSLAGTDRPSANPQTVTARFRAVLDDSEDGWYCQASHVLDQVQALLDSGAAGDVMELCEQAVWCLLNAAPEIEDGEAVMSLIDRLRRLHVRACTVVRPNPVQLASFVYQLATDNTMGVLHGVIDPYVSLLGEKGLAEIRRRLAAEEASVRESSAIRRSIWEFRLRPIHASLARADHPDAM